MLLMLLEILKPLSATTMQLALLWHCLLSQRKEAKTLSKTQ